MDCVYCGRPADNGLCPDWKAERRMQLNRIKRGNKVVVADYSHRGEKREF